ncbi:hypothetical protein AVEN_205165-1, partial [Araneus ventricosus]
LGIGKSAAVVGGKGCVGGIPSGSRGAIAGVLQELVPVKYCEWHLLSNQSEPT